MPQKTDRLGDFSVTIGISGAALECAQTSMSFDEITGKASRKLDFRRDPSLYLPFQCPDELMNLDLIPFEKVTIGEDLATLPLPIFVGEKSDWGFDISFVWDKPVLSATFSNSDCS
jgi:hypothetical protein